MSTAAIFTDMPMLRSLLAILLALCLAAPARAQFWGAPMAPPAPPAPPAPVGPPPAPKPPAAAKPAVPGGVPGAAPGQTAATPQGAAQDQPAPYDRDLERLSEILGALHFLRGICNSDEGQKWRNEAQALIDAEAPAGGRHDQMVAGFNRGYRGFQQNYRTCTPAADAVIRRYLEEGAKIARDITARYAN
jgi:uncharacterized protein (TIGR02301 family)